MVAQRFLGAGMTLLLSVFVAASVEAFAETDEETLGRHTVDIATGYTQTCALSNDGKVKCWGASYYGELGIPNVSNLGGSAFTMGKQLPYVDLGKDFSARELCAGDYFTCALSTKHQMKCWGRNSFGQLGQGDATSYVGKLSGQMGDALKFTDLGEDFVPAHISCGATHACALSNDGKAKCWGSNGSGEIGLDPTKVKSIGRSKAETGSNLKILPFAQKVEKIVAAADSTCVQLQDGYVCWGANQTGQSGVEATETSRSFVQVNGDFAKVKLEETGIAIRPIDLSAAAASVCARYRVSAGSSAEPLTEKVKCWGNNNEGQLGAGLTGYNIGRTAGSMGPKLPEVQLDLKGVSNLQMHGPFACASDQAGILKCWGYNLSGALGLGDRVSRGRNPMGMGKNLPVTDLDLPIVKLSSGYARHSCALLLNHEVKCWGYGFYGALGYENTEDIGKKPGDMGSNLGYVNIW